MGVCVARADDSTAISAWAANSHPYRAYADVDLDGDVDATDASYTTNDNMGWDVLSRDGSTVGYAGYVIGPWGRAAACGAENHPEARVR